MFPLFFCKKVKKLEGLHISVWGGERYVRTPSSGGATIARPAWGLPWLIFCRKPSFSSLFKQ